MVSKHSHPLPSPSPYPAGAGLGRGMGALNACAAALLTTYPAHACRDLPRG